MNNSIREPQVELEEMYKVFEQTFEENFQKTDSFHINIISKKEARLISRLCFSEGLMLGSKYGFSLNNQSVVKEKKKPYFLILIIALMLLLSISSIFITIHILR